MSNARINHLRNVLLRSAGVLAFPPASVNHPLVYNKLAMSAYSGTPKKIIKNGSPTSWLSVTI